VKIQPHCSVSIGFLVPLPDYKIQRPSLVTRGNLLIYRFGARDFRRLRQKRQKNTYTIKAPDFILLLLVEPDLTQKIQSVFFFGRALIRLWVSRPCFISLEGPRPPIQEEHMVWKVGPYLCSCSYLSPRATGSERKKSILVSFAPAENLQKNGGAGLEWK